MTYTISNTAYAILKALHRGAQHTADIRTAVGKDPHPILGRDVLKRGWATQSLNGITLTAVGRAAYELGRRERESVTADELDAYGIPTLHDHTDTET